MGSWVCRKIAPFSKAKSVLQKLPYLSSHPTNGFQFPTFWCLLELINPFLGNKNLISKFGPTFFLVFFLKIWRSGLSEDQLVRKQKQMKSKMQQNEEKVETEAYRGSPSLLLDPRSCKRWKRSVSKLREKESKKVQEWKRRKPRSTLGSIFIPTKTFKVQTKDINHFFRQFRAQWTLKNPKSFHIWPRYASRKKCPLR